MASPFQTQKKRPPPIEIPPPYPQRPVIPGPNAFAIAERAALAKQEEQRRRAEHNRQQSQSRPGPSGHSDVPQASDPAAADDISSPGLPRSNSTSFQIPSKEALSSLVDMVRKSPRKSGYSHNSSSTTSRHASTTRSRHSERSYHSMASAQRQLEGLNEETTSRGEIEAQKERKLFKLMGQVPDTPKTGAAPLPDDHVNITDLRQGKRVCVSSKKLDRVEEVVTRSPKKKIFGVSIPFSRIAINPTSTPPMPPKAAKLMGASPVKTRKFSPLTNMSNISGGKFVPRSDTSKSLPSKLYNQSGYRGRLRSPIHEGLSRGRTPRKASPTKPLVKATPFSHEITLEALTGSEEIEIPPIPPRKDSLLNVRQRFPDLQHKIVALKAINPPRTVSQLLRPPTPEAEPEDFKDSGMKLFVPLAPQMDPIPLEGGESPSKYCPTNVADRPEFVEAEPIFSARGLVEYTIQEENESAHSAPLKSPDKGSLPTLRTKRRSAPATPTSAWVRDQAHVDAPPPDNPSLQLEYLLPTVYSPPKTAVRKTGDYLFDQIADHFQLADRPRSDSPTPRSKRGSIPIIFQGDVGEIDPQSATARAIVDAASEPSSKTCDDIGGVNLTERIMEELHIKPLANGAAQVTGALQPEKSSSQLTDMLNGLSPSRVHFHEFNGSSAAPSPLHGAHQSSQSGPPHPTANAAVPGSGHDQPVFLATTMPPPPRSGVPIHDHFYMTNEHIDVVAMSIYDWVSSCNNQVIKAASSKHEQLKTAVEQQFEDIKSQINSVGEKADHNGNQSHNLSVQLDKLRDFIKTEVVEPLSAQAQKASAMEQGIKELQKAVQDLQKSAVQNQVPTPAYSSPQQPPFALPNARSQPSLPGFYDSNGSGHGPAPPVPSASSTIGRYGANTQLGRSTYGREGRENSSFAFPNTGNPYHSPGTSFNQGYGTGGYQQSINNYSPMHDQQSYGYNQGLQK